MNPRIYTADEARALREAAPAGPYEACHPDDLPGRSIVMGGREVRPPYDAFVVGLEDRPRVALAELFAASPDLAATVEAQSAEISRLRDVIEQVRVELVEVQRPDLALDALAKAGVWCDGGGVCMVPLTDAALDAACAAEDRACADDPLLDGTDGAHPAWWRGHDRAAEMLTAQRDAAVALLAEVWHEIATGRPPPVSDRTAWLAQVGDVVGAASYCAALDAARGTLTRERDATLADAAALRAASEEMLAALVAPAPAWDGDESEHDAHAARVTLAMQALLLAVWPKGGAR